MRIVLIFLAVCVLSGCAGVSEPPLAKIHKDDPIWALTPDHLQYGELPQ